MATADEPTWSDFARVVRAKIARDLVREDERAEELRAVVLPAVAGALSRARRGGLCGAAWVFGSYAWGRPGERSDVDLLVEDCRDPDGLAASVASACERDVHVVTRSAAPVTLVARVLADGKAL